MSNSTGNLAIDPQQPRLPEYASFIKSHLQLQLHCIVHSLSPYFRCNFVFNVWLLLKNIPPSMGRASVVKNDIVSNQKLLKLYVSQVDSAHVHTYPYYFTQLPWYFTQFPLLPCYFNQFALFHFLRAISIEQRLFPYIFEWATYALYHYIANIKPFRGLQETPNLHGPLKKNKCSLEVFPALLVCKMAIFALLGLFPFNYLPHILYNVMNLLIVHFICNNKVHNSLY